MIPSFCASSVRGLRERITVRRGVVAGLAICFAFLFCPRGLRAQALSGINGTVTDTSGAVVPGAKVTITNVDTNVSQTAVTTSVGSYYVTDLIPGTYTVKVEKLGFKAFLSNGVVVAGGATSTVNATLSLGAASATVEVKAPSVSLQTEQPQVGTTVNETLMQNLPQVISGQNRQIDNFIFLAPGVTGGGFSHRINGGVDQQTEVMFNGVPEAFSETAGFTQWNQPPYDSIKDVDVLTGTFSAQYGLGQGVEQYRIKSGTNQIHGDAFAFYRDAFFDAPGANNDVFGNNVGTPDAPNTDHEIDWGFSVGGPVFIPKLYNGKDKTFWFFSYDRYRHAFGQGALTVPIPAFVPTGNGADFSNLVRFDSTTNSFVQIPVYVPIAWATNPSLMPSGCVPGAAPGKQFPGNIIPQSCISAVSQTLLKFIPAPNISNAVGNNSNFFPRSSVLDLEPSFIFNIDHNLTSKQAIHGLYWRQSFPTPGGGIPNPLNNSILNTVLAHAIDVTYSNTLSPSLVTTAGVLYVYQKNDFTPQYPFPGNFLGAQPSSPGASVVLPGINFGGAWQPTCWGTNGCGGWQVSLNHKTGYSIMNNWLYQNGRHTINFGVDIRRTSQLDDECQQCGGSLFFGSDITADPTETTDFPGSSGIGSFTGDGFATFLLGDANSATRSFAGATELSNTYVAPYFQDDVQITTRLKLNLGLRWDMAFPFTNNNASNQLAFWDPNVPNPGAISTITGQPLMGAMTILGPTTAQCPGCVGWQHMDMFWDHFSPRAGFTYQLNSKTVLLGGVSWYWLDTGAFEYGVNKVAANFGNDLHGVFNAPQNTTQIPGYGQWDTNPLPSPQGGTFSASFLNGAGGGVVHQMSRHVNQAYDEQFVIGIQRELPWNMFLSVSGVHTHDLHLPASLLSAVNSLNYNFVQSMCAPGIPDSLDCALGSAWTCTAQTFANGVPAPPCQAGGTQPQAILQAQGFGLAPCTTFNGGGAATCPASGMAYAPYANFNNDWGPGQGLFQAFAPYPQFGFIQNNFDTSGADKYNALQVSLQKRTGSGLTFLVGYTLSRYLTNTDSGFSTFNFRGLNPQNPNAEWSVGANDQTHVLTMAGVYELPFGPGRKFLNHGGLAMKNLVGGWEISMVNTYQSGLPFTLAACGNQPGCDPLVFSTNGFNRPNVAGPNFGLNWNNLYKNLPVINRADFSYPGGWRFGNGAPLYNDLRTAFQSNENVSLQKKFFFTERISGALSMEWFDVLNRMQVGNCLDSNVTDPNFGFQNGGVPGLPCQGNTPRQGQAEFQLFF